MRSRETVSISGYYDDMVEEVEREVVYDQAARCSTVLLIKTFVLSVVRCIRFVRKLMNLNTWCVYCLGSSNPKDASDLRPLVVDYQLSASHVYIHNFMVGITSRPRFSGAFGIKVKIASRHITDHQSSLIELCPFTK